MASLTFDSFWDDVSRNNISMSADTFYVMLVTSTYSPAKKTHTRRSDVTNEVVGAGYAAGGVASACTVTKDTANDKETYAFAVTSWAASTITARAAVIYKHRGGAAANDELVAYADFGSDIISTAGTFQVTFSTPITLQN